MQVSTQIPSDKLLNYNQIYATGTSSTTITTGQSKATVQLPSMRINPAKSSLAWNENLSAVIDANANIAARTYRFTHADCFSYVDVFRIMLDGIDVLNLSNYAQISKMLGPMIKRELVLVRSRYFRQYIPFRFMNLTVANLAVSGARYGIDKQIPLYFRQGVAFDAVGDQAADNTTRINNEMDYEGGLIQYTTFDILGGFDGTDQTLSLIKNQIQFCQLFPLSLFEQEDLWINRQLSIEMTFNPYTKISFSARDAQLGTNAAASVIGGQGNYTNIAALAVNIVLSQISVIAAVYQDQNGFDFSIPRPFHYADVQYNSVLNYDTSMGIEKGDALCYQFLSFFDTAYVNQNTYNNANIADTNGIITLANQNSPPRKVPALTIKIDGQNQITNMDTSSLIFETLWKNNLPSRYQMSVDNFQKYNFTLVYDYTQGSPFNGKSLQRVRQFGFAVTSSSGAQGVIAPSATLQFNLVSIYTRVLGYDQNRNPIILSLQ